jgi:hypothetical protein
MVYLDSTTALRSCKHAGMNRYNVQHRRFRDLCSNAPGALSTDRYLLRPSSPQHLASPSRNFSLRQAYRERQKTTLAL